MSSPEQPYKMTLSLNVLNHLGLNLYSNTPAVLSEVVANAWDADAENVEIIISSESDQIIISDDGHGMSIDDANEKYLMVGYQRREHGEGITPKHKRKVMGRKGIGKLSLFSIAQIIDVFSVKNGEKHGFRMRLEEIKTQIQTDDGEKIYQPEVLTDFPLDLTKGTRIVINQFKRRLRDTEANLKRRLARRFSVLGESFNFKIKINNIPVTVEDRDYFHKVEFLWTYDNPSSISTLCSSLNHHDNRDGKIAGTDYVVQGWLGTVKNSGDLKDEYTNDNLNKIIVMVRGKVAQEDILDEFNEGGMYTKYIFGELHADFLDSDDEDDIATSSRQSILEDDPRYQKLKEFLHLELKHIQSQWTELRNEEGLKKALEISAVNDWFKSLGTDSKKRAKSLFGKINKLTIDSEAERKSLLKHGILAFESLRVKDNLDALEKLDGGELETFVSIFQDIDDIEASFYRQIVMSRIEVIRSLKEKIDANVRERILQEHLYEHLWLLDPGWERADSTEAMEQRVSKEFGDIDAGLSDEEKKGRIDIKYRTTSGKHLIIELKKADRKVSTYELMEQCDKYRNGLKKILVEIKRQYEPIETVCVVGIPLKDWVDEQQREESRAALEKKQIRVVLYQELVDTAERSYSAYLKKQQESGRIYDLIQKIDEEA